MTGGIRRPWSGRQSRGGITGFGLSLAARIEWDSAGGPDAKGEKIKADVRAQRATRGLFHLLAR
jgi:hypothetical protein